MSQQLVHQETKHKCPIEQNAITFNTVLKYMLEVWLGPCHIREIKKHCMMKIKIVGKDQNAKFAHEILDKERHTGH